MPTGRRTARRKAVFTLYQQDLLELGVEDALHRVEEEDSDAYASRIVEGVGVDISRLDDLLQRHLSGWRIERLGVLERAILRVAAYELLVEDDVPVAVVVDEAVGLAKRFCSPEAGALVNGILAHVAAETRGTDPAAERGSEVTQ